MSKRKRKIVLPTDDEVDQFGGESAGADEAGADSASGSGEEGAKQEPRSEAEEWKDKFLRSKAELANYQRRAEKDRSESLRYANAQLVQALLPILDDLERVIASGAEPNSEVPAVISGVQLTLDNFLKALKSFNVATIESEGQPFDPAIHEAMMQQPSGEHSEPTVLQETAKGYRLHDRVLRPARVIVSKPPESDCEDREAEAGDGDRSAPEPAAGVDGD